MDVIDPAQVRLDATPLIRAGISSMLASYPERAVLLCQGSTRWPDVEMVDLTGRIGSAPDVRESGAPVVVLARRGERRHAEDAAALGASRVLFLDVTATELLEAVEEARAETATHDGRDLDPRMLSRREAEVLVGICRGLTNAEVAEELYLSVNSVKTYIRSAYQKIGVGRRSQAVRWGIENGYVRA
jgi:DNA-binding NarL/FixJ family response regulator